MAGFFCVIQKGCTAELGVALRLDLCGHGVERKIVLSFMDFITAHYRFTELKLNASEFKERVIKAYRSSGITISHAFKQSINGGMYDFPGMTKTVE